MAVGEQKTCASEWVYSGARELPIIGLDGDVTGAS